MEDLFDKLKELTDAGKYEEAMIVFRSIKESKAKTAQDFMSIAKVYGHNGDFKKAVKFFEKAYKKRPSRLIYREMIQLCIECDEGDLAEKYFDEYAEMGSTDKATLLELKYKIQILVGASSDEKIETLKALKTENYTEENAMELCKQLYKAGKTDECKKECQTLISVFEEGPYVARAKTLLAVFEGEITMDSLKAQLKKSEKVGKEPEKVEQEPIKESSSETTEDAETVKEVETTEDVETEANIVEDEFVVEGLAEAVAEVVDNDSESETVEQEVVESVEPDESEVAAEAIGIDESEVAAEAVESDEPEEIEIYHSTLTFSNDELPEGKVKNLVVANDIDMADVFKTYIMIDEVRRQIIRSLDMCINQRGARFLTIDGEDSSGKGVLSARFIKCLYEMQVINSPLAAVVSSENLTVEFLKKNKDRLKGKGLIIEKGASLTPEVLSEVLKMSGKHGLSVVVLTDTAKNLGSFLRLDPKINEIFNNRIHLSKYNVEERMSFVVDIFHEEDYEVEKTAADYIYRILSKNTKTESLGAICNYVKKVSGNADRRVAPEILRMAKEAKYEDRPMVVMIDDLSVTLDDQTLN